MFDEESTGRDGSSYRSVYSQFSTGGGGLLPNFGDF